MQRCKLKILQYFIFFFHLTLPTIALAASGWVSIDSPADGYTTTGSFWISISYALTEDNGACGGWAGGDLNWAALRVKLDSKTIGGTELSTVLYKPYPSTPRYGFPVYVNISGLDKAISHTVTAYLEDEYSVAGVCRSGGIFAQDTLTFRVCDGSTDPCCQPNANECCWDNDPCCGSTDLCCGSSDPCCGSMDPCCGSPDPCCGKEDDPCCGDRCCGETQCCPPPGGSSGGGGGGPGPGPESPDGAAGG